jgi:hypothetical protein
MRIDGYDYRNFGAFSQLDELAAARYGWSKEPDQLH